MGVTKFLEDFHNLISETIQQSIGVYIDAIKKILAQFAEIIYEMIAETIAIWKLSIPDFSFSINNYTYPPQAPPICKTKESKWSRFKNSNFINWFKSNLRELPNTIAQNAMYDLLKFAIITAATYYITHYL